jgi:TetR/AcrR family transcriptional repressor of nem operon
MIDAAEIVDVRQHILDTAQRIMGSKGFSAVGLNEILAAAKVPKGSFYHYFASKDAFGEAMLESYFVAYLKSVDAILNAPGLSAAEQLMNYWQTWKDAQISGDPTGKCLAVKLGAEVADLSEAMRLVLKKGTSDIVTRLADAIMRGVAEKSIAPEASARDTAHMLYNMWFGASVIAKITRDSIPFDVTLTASRQILRIANSKKTAPQRAKA